MPNLKIFIAGHNGMVGSALVRLLKKQEAEIITANRTELNLLNQTEVQNFFKENKIDQVY
jgi:GDP-L-fucose synthase